MRIFFEQIKGTLFQDVNDMFSNGFSHFHHYKKLLYGAYRWENNKVNFL